MFKEIIIKELGTLVKKERLEKNIFKVRAYEKVIKQLEKIEKIKGWKDLEGVSGIGKKISEKIDEIFKTGRLESAERVRSEKDLEIYDILMKIHGVGPKKAKELVEKYLIKSIDDLKIKLEENPGILNKKQKMGLKYYEDINLKIPRKEMIEHDKFIMDRLMGLDKDIEIMIVGSYRRKLKESGDIDVLVRLRRDTDKKERSELLNKIIKELEGAEYIKSVLAMGDKKFMGIVKLKRKRHARRMDILITTEEEFPFAVLYFTGSKELNIILRKEARERGYVLNEYSLLAKRGRWKLKTEEEIFNKLGYRYIAPENRTIPEEIYKFKMEN